jgi:hypothetical protein
VHDGWADGFRTIGLSKSKPFDTLRVPGLFNLAKRIRPGAKPFITLIV